MFLLYVQALVQGGDLKWKDEIRFDRTALQIAAASGSADCVAFLFQNGADLNYKDSKGMTAVDIAGKQNNTEVFRYLQNK